MLAPTHSVFGVFLTLIVLALFGVRLSLHWTILVFAVLGAILPDADYPTSVIGRLLYPISSRLERKFGHRTVTHSLIGWMAATIGFGVIIAFISLIPQISSWGWGELPPRWFAAFSISYLSHLILDMFNKRGSQLFWPDQTRDVIPRDHKSRIASGSRAEIIVFICVLIMLVLALPISKYGLPSTIHWLLATSGSAIEEFKGSNTLAYLEFKGHFKDTMQPVEGKAEILDAQNKRLVVLYKGHIYTISDELASDILADKLRVKRTDIPLKFERREFKDETRDYLLSQIPKGARISGVINLPEGMKVTIPPYAGSFSPFEQKGDKLYLHYASKEMIEELGLTEQFDVQKEKDLVELSRLQIKAKSIRGQVENIESEASLTKLGQELLLTPEEIEKRNAQLDDLRNQLQEIDLKVKEVNI
ncbi:MAG: metal-dependent hydrolase, partial [Candidatus Margulisbacteria bacterium]|nr:metal-dependent hydrolase [Candidatus Margulisiibacteriota bacterium]